MIVVNFFYSEWASARGINGDIGQKTKAELDANLRLFYAEARNKDGGNYSRSTLLRFRNGLESYLNNPPYKKGIHIATDPAFQQSNVISLTTPQGLLYNVWFHFTLYFCRHGWKGQRNLTRSSFLFLLDENKKWYATMAHDEQHMPRGDR